MKTERHFRYEKVYVVFETKINKQSIIWENINFSNYMIIVFNDKAKKYNKCLHSLIYGAMNLAKWCLQSSMN